MQHNTTPCRWSCLLCTLGVEGAAGGDEGGAEAAAHRFGEKHVGFVWRTNTRHNAVVFGHVQEEFIPQVRACSVQSLSPKQVVGLYVIILEHACLDALLGAASCSCPSLQRAGVPVSTCSGRCCVAVGVPRAAKRRSVGRFCGCFKKKKKM